MLDILLDNHYIRRIGSQQSGFAGLLVNSFKKSTISDHQQYRLSDSIIIKINDLDIQDDHDNVILGVLGNYDLIEKIGEGGFSEVYKARDRRTVNQVVVVKQAKKFNVGDVSPVTTLHNEARLLTKLAKEENNNIVNLHENKSKADPSYLALESIEGVNLKEALLLINTFNLVDVLALLPQLINPIALLHELEIFQLDIKPANFMLTRGGDIYLIDLGSAIDLSISGQQKGAGLRIGTSGYAAPELQDGHIHSLELADVYSFGVMIYELLFGKLPSDSALEKLRFRLPISKNNNHIDENSSEFSIDLQINPGKLRRLIINYFNESELKDLCFDLSIDYEGLPGTGKWEKARELVDYILRTDRFQELMDALDKSRPQVSWESSYQKTKPQTSSSTDSGPPNFKAPKKSRASQKLSNFNGPEEQSIILDALARALAIDPQQRFASVDDLGKELSLAIKSHTISNPADIAKIVLDLHEGLLEEERNATMFLNENMVAIQTIGSVNTTSQPISYPSPRQVPIQTNINFTSRLSTTSQLLNKETSTSYVLVNLQTNNVYQLTGNGVSNGRLQSNDIVLEHPSVSRQNSLLEYREPGQWVVVNLQSSNGTFVNGRRLDRAIPLIPDDIIKVGQFELRFEPLVTSDDHQESRSHHPELLGQVSPDTILVNRYKVMRVIGEGGMGYVYLALDMQLNKLVALKQLKVPGHLNADSEFEENRHAFTSEIKILERLSHPNIIQLFDHFYIGSEPFYVMEYADGQTAGSIMNQTAGQPLSENLVLIWTHQICNALEYLHNYNPPIIYRDMKPGNLMISSANKVKLLDFGIARYFKKGRTKDTVRLGTPGYAAPEQYSENQQTDETTDIYSLGSTIHAFLTGLQADDRQNPLIIPPVNQFNPDVSPHISKAIEKATNPVRSQRFRSIKEFWQSLDPSGQYK